MARFIYNSKHRTGQCRIALSAADCIYFNIILIYTNSSTYHRILIRITQFIILSFFSDCHSFHCHINLISFRRHGFSHFICAIGQNFLFCLCKTFFIRCKCHHRITRLIHSPIYLYTLCASVDHSKLSACQISISLRLILSGIQIHLLKHKSATYYFIYDRRTCLIHDLTMIFYGEFNRLR